MTIDNTLEKRENENEFEHHKRLVYGKLKDKTLADYDYAELSEYVYGKQYSPDDTRKRMYGSAATLEILDELGIQSLNEDDFLKEIKAKQIDLQKEKQMFYDQRREFNKLVSAEGRKDHLYECLTEAAHNLPNSVGRFVKDELCETAPQDSEASFVLCLNDWHYGMVAENVWNEYNTEICRDRVSIILKETIDKIRLHGCQKLYILLLGDAIDGCIHTSSRVASEELVCDQLMQVSELIAQFILMISNYVPEVEVYSTFGNHARSVQNKKDNLHMDNMERIIGWWLKQRIAAEFATVDREPNITINCGTDYEFILFDVYGYGFCASHGDLDSVKTSPRLLTMLFHKAYGQEIDYVLLADKHHEESFEELGVEALLCGSLCGTDEYANNKRLYSEPSQLLLVVDPIHGVDARYKLNCN